MPPEEEQEGEPFLHSPDILDDDPRNGLMCFLNGDRQCGPDCMGWLTISADVATLDEQPSHCLLIVSAERLSRHAVILTKVVADSAARGRAHEQDRKREQQPTPPSPRGDP